MLYKGSQSLGEYTINYEVWNAANHADKYTLSYYVTSAKLIDCISFDADITSSKPDRNGATSVSKNSLVCLRNGKSGYESFNTGFIIESPKNKLKSIKFSNLKVTYNGKSVNNGSSNPNR
jgi:hypothetical protein